MKIIIDGSPEEIAALTVELQERQCDASKMREIAETSLTKVFEGMNRTTPRMFAE